MPTIFVQIVRTATLPLFPACATASPQPHIRRSFDSASVGSMTQAKTFVSSSRIRDFAWSMFPIETAQVAARSAFAEENKLSVAAVENKAGEFVLPTAEGASAAPFP